MTLSGGPVQAVRWEGDPQGGALVLLDQTRLPVSCDELRVRDAESVRDAIVRLAVRGAPAIGVAGGFGLWLAVRDARDESAFAAALSAGAARLRGARPTAVNLAWAVDRVVRRASVEDSLPARKLRAFEEASAILAEDVATCARLAGHGASLLAKGARVLTYCNTGALAAAGCGTALAAVFEAHRQGAAPSVIACETRPLLQGARLTMWELLRQGIPATLICDNTAAVVLRRGDADVVLVGADRIARNGDVANKIGTYGLATLAKAHGVPFFVVAPRSTFDLSLASGDMIPIEERPESEITEISGRRIAPPGARAFAPAFDVTPAGSITGIVTEAGIIRPVGEAAIRRIVAV